jgi:hypothetical protein
LTRRWLGGLLGSARHGDLGPPRALPGPAGHPLQLGVLRPTAGSALAAFSGGLLHNAFGDYQVTFLSAGLAGLAAAGFSLQLREGRHREAAAPPAPPTPALSSAR